MKAINLLLVCLTFYLRTAAQKSDSTLILHDSITGMEKRIVFIFDGSSSGPDGGRSPKNMTRRITKMNKDGKLLYESELCTTMRGCIRDYVSYHVIAIEPSGAYKTLCMKKKGFETISFDKKGKQLSSVKTKYIQALWLDSDESRFSP